MKARLLLDRSRVVGPVDPRVFGGFVEHLGRAIYGGLYDPESNHADSDGWRADVLEALARLDFTILRYPGGNFVSGYDWRDGIGPRESRPERIDEAWNTLEPNLVGTDEFVSLSQRLGWQPMITVNLGSGTPSEAADWVRYCKDQGYSIKTWCLGNEMDGEWQIGHIPAPEYAKKAGEAARLMRLVDPDIELVACGSSNPDMPTWLTWDRTVLEGLHDVADFISLHRYAVKKDDDSEDYLAITNDIDRQIESIDALCRDVAERTGGKRAYLCFDEWNVWYRTQFKRFSDGDGTFAPRLIEEVYNLEDALVVAGYLNSFIRHADSVRIANLAQIVNAIAPLLTEGDDLLVQSIFWPFEMMSRRRNGIALDVGLESPSYSSKSYGEATYLDASAILDDGHASIFMVNKSARELEVTIVPTGFSFNRLKDAECVWGGGLDATNTLDDPRAVFAHPFEQVTPTNDGGAVVELPPYSFVAATLTVS